MDDESEKLRHFHDWLLVNRVELRGCTIKYRDQSKGFGIVSSPTGTNIVNERVLLVVPLDLAITPMRVIQDPLIGPECRAMFEEGEVDDRFLIILFLLLEHLRKHSTWKPYLDMLPRSFGSPLWFNDQELHELKGTALYRATELQKKQLLSIFHDKVEGLIKKLLVKDGYSESVVRFEDFLWANSVFWTRAMNIPFPHSYVFPKTIDVEPSCSETSKNETPAENGSMIFKSDVLVDSKSSELTPDETVWVEGIIPGIDFCNHDVKAQATWEIDGAGTKTGVPFSMFLQSAVETPFKIDQDISISYGNKGNEELLYLYGFVIDNNPDDYLMINYPIEALKHSSFSETRMQLLEAQKAELRYLLPKSLLHHGFTSMDSNQVEQLHYNIADKQWSSHHKVPSYVNNLLFPEGLLTTLRTIAMEENELCQVQSLLEQEVGCGQRQPTDEEVSAAVREACGDSGACQLLVNLLQTKLMDLEEGSGSEDCDTKLLDEHKMLEKMDQSDLKIKSLGIKTWSSIVYRRGQKQLARLFLREAEQALQLCFSQDN